MLSVLIGDNVRVKSVFTDADTGAYVDPPDVTFFVAHAPPSTAIDTYTYSGSTVTRLSAGTYECVFQVTTTGTWSWSAKGSNGEGRDAGLVNVVADPAYS